jgi:hypothetical protein
MKTIWREMARRNAAGRRILPRHATGVGSVLRFGGVTSFAMMFLVAALEASPVVTTNSAGSLILTNHFGDLNDDRQIDVRDIVLLTHHLKGMHLLAAPMLTRADLNQDGKVDDGDRSILANMIAARNTGPADDFDGDELANTDEIRTGTKPFDPDTDHDGWLDGWEVSEVTDPLSAQSYPKTFALARPPVQILSPLIQDSDTNTFGTVLARPPVQVISPAKPEVEEAGATTMVRPPVLLCFPALAQVEEAGATTLARPPVLLCFPALVQVEEAGATTLAHPPVTVTNRPPQ